MSAPARPPKTPILPGPRALTAAGAGLAIAGLVAYFGSFSVPFIFDDVPSILGNQSIRQLWPLTVPLSPPAETLGLPVGGRPLVNLSLAINYRLGGTNPMGYHAFNLGVHFLVGLVLYGLVSRTLRQPVLSPRINSDASSIALAVTALWILHPLQTESVTYICQRAESLMALCYVTTLYAFVRSVGSPAPSRWRAIAVFACLFGMACKEVMVSAPVIVLLYDRTFVANSFHAAWRVRGRFYLALGATWLLLLVLVASNFDRGGTAGFEAGVTPWNYALTQSHAIIHYLRLSLWPDALVFDYGTLIFDRLADVVLPGILVAGLFALTIAALLRRSPLGFVGISFFAILAPTSTFIPVATQTMAEHRMYLPLAAVLTLVVLGVHRIAGQRAIFVCALLAALLGSLTALRNRQYRSELGLWQDTITKRPTNARAHSNLGIELYKMGRAPEAIQAFETAIRLRPNFPDARANIGVALLNLRQPDTALPHFSAALAEKPEFPEAWSNLGLALKQLGRTEEAIQAFEKALRIKPDYADAHHNLGIALLERGDMAKALHHFEVTIRLRPDLADVRSNVAVALMRLGRLHEAVLQCEHALRLRPGYPAAAENLALLKARLGGGVQK